VNSCLTLAVQVEATRILTVEGLVTAIQLHPVQAMASVRTVCRLLHARPDHAAVACIQEGHAGNEMASTSG
jgi:hypothetical protein